MGLLNYTTSISVSKTLSEIHDMLQRAGALATLSEFDGARNVVAVSFKIRTAHGVASFRLPCNPVAVQKILNDQVMEKTIPKRFLNNMDQARRVGWRIIRQWLEAQLAIVETEMVTIEQVMLPYAQTENGETVYERLSRGKLAMLALEQ